MSDDTAIDADTLRQLYTRPPGDFIAARKQLVKELRGAGDRATAMAVGALRKPSVVDWALNVVATEHPEVVGDYLDAAARVREQLAPGAGGGRDAVRELRSQASRVVALADEENSAAGGRGSITAPATARLAELVADAGAGEQLRAGQLGASGTDAVDPFAAFGGGEDATPAPPHPARGTKKAAKPAKTAAPERERQDAEWRRRLQDALEEAEQRAADAQDALDAAEGALTEATDAVDAAEATLVERRRQLADAKAAHAKAGRESERAAAAVDRARDRFATLGSG